jgi:exonuclease SbcC
MGIDLFDKLYDIAREDVADEKAYLRRIKEKNVFESMGRIEQKLKDLKENKIEVIEKIKPVENDINNFKSQVEELKSKLKDVDDIKEIDFDGLIVEKESELETQKEALKLEEQYKDNIRPLYNTIYSKLKEYDEDTLDHNYKKFQECKEDLSKIKSDVTVKENKIKHLETSLEEVKEHEFDENCEYCLKNGQWHIEKTKSLTSEIKDCKLELEKILTEKSHREKDIESFGDIEQDKSKYEDLMEDLKRVEGDAYKTHAKIKELELSVDQTQSVLEKILEDKQLFLDNGSAIAYNRNIMGKVDKYQTQVKIGSDILEELNKQLNKIESTILIEETNQKNLGEEIKDLVEAEQKVSDYEVYLRLVSRDGIPQLIINDALPIIENEVNAVLDHMMAGFQLGITNEDKNINLYIRYDDQEWPLNLSSGMEKFVSSLALRVGLINVSNLPSPNFLVIDEGFGTLDTDNLSNMKGAFEYLKTRFDSVFIISHLDTIKDFMDYLLPVNVSDDGFSKVIYN